MKYLFCVLLMVAGAAHAQVKPKVVSECTVEFEVQYGDTAAAARATMTVYIKGAQSRVDFVSPAFSQIKFYNAKEHTAVILQDLGATKVRRDLDSTKWSALNSKYEGLTVENTNETKAILGYECRKANITLKDGGTFSLYYATAIVPSNKEYEFQFRAIPGFVLEYETTDASNQKVKFTATRINLSPVPPSRMEVPKSGYRIL